MVWIYNWGHCMSEENPALLQEIVTVAAEDTTGRDDEENETIIPAKETN